MNFGADDDERLTPFEEDKPKCDGITPFKAGLDSMFSAIHEVTEYECNMDGYGRKAFV